MQAAEPHEDLGVDRRSLPERIAARLQALIVEGRYPPGSQLPHQRDLAAQLGVSTTVIRESLALLAAAGMVWSRSGQGTFVTDQPPATLRFPAWVRRPSTEAELLEATEARDALEHAIVRLAARRCTPEDVEGLRGIVRRMRESAGDAEAYAEADMAFHLAVAEAARNRPLAGALAGLRRFIAPEMLQRARRAIADGTIEVSVTSHAEVVDALERHDPDAALATMDAILERARRASNLPETAG